MYDNINDVINNNSKSVFLDKLHNYSISKPFNSFFRPNIFFRSLQRNRSLFFLRLILVDNKMIYF